jgi:hypothetical protein
VNTPTCSYCRYVSITTLGLKLEKRGKGRIRTTLLLVNGVYTSLSRYRPAFSVVHQGDGAKKQL